MESTSLKAISTDYEEQLLPGLTKLISELEELEEWPRVKVDGVLLLYDVCRCLNLSPETTLKLLGNVATYYLVEQGIVDKTVAQRYSRSVALS